MIPNVMYTGVYTREQSDDRNTLLVFNDGLRKQLSYT